jgi:Lipopolysaccharide-assembly
MPAAFKKIVWCFALAAPIPAFLLPSCDWDGQFTILGYTTRPNYDLNIKTVRVPIFKNVTYWRGLEFDLTRAVVREIEAKTPYKVVGPNCTADTELTGTITNFQKNIINRTQLNEVREAETVLSVEVVWRDLRPDRVGEILSRPRPAPNAPVPPPPPPGAPPPPVPGTLVQSIGHFAEELGQSTTTAQKENVDRLAAHIVEMMERPW